MVKGISALTLMDSLDQREQETRKSGKMNKLVKNNSLNILSDKFLEEIGFE